VFGLEECKSLRNWALKPHLADPLNLLFILYLSSTPHLDEDEKPEDMLRILDEGQRCDLIW